MYLNILKKDLKRKKSMNVVLLLFAILASMFVSSGLSNVITVMNGTDYYLQKAGIGDFIVITQNGDGGTTQLLEETDFVSDYKVEKCFWSNKSEIIVNGNEAVAKNNVIALQPFANSGITYFTADDEPLKAVNPGELYVTAGFLDKNNTAIGEELEINFHGIDKRYKIAGEMKDALLGSDMMGNTRIIINEDDFSIYENDESLAPYAGCVFNIFTSQPTKLSAELGNISNILFSGNKDMIKLCYVMDMILAMIVLVLSVVLCIISFILLKFVISFTISEEVREIGVMKAIGIKNAKIRSLYIVKYFVISVVGGLVGFFAGIPFGNMLIDSVSKKMLLGQDMGIWANVLGTFLVILIMIAFAYSCTGKINKHTPVDAIRDGQVGERFGKKSSLSLSKSKLTNAFFMGLNDVLSAPKRFLTIILSFSICSVFVFGVVLVVDTMKSDRLVGTFGKPSDVYITDSKLVQMTFLIENGGKLLSDACESIEKDLESMDMPADVNMEVWYRYPVTIGDDTVSVMFQQNQFTETTDYDYLEGTAPQNKNEIAITKQIAKSLEIEIGDTITIDFGGEKLDCIVVAYFQTMNQLGSLIRLHPDAPTSMEYASVIMAYQIDFKDQPSADEIQSRIDEIKDFYNIENVFDAAGYCDDCMGTAATMDTVAKLLLFITCIVVILVTVLMERGFISDETSQIALLKAVGFKDSFVIKWHVYRFMIVSVASELLAIVLTYPVTKLWCDPIFSMMGALNVAYYFKPLSLLVIYPGIILGINLLATYVTALYTKKIKANDVRNIE